MKASVQYNQDVAIVKVDVSSSIWFVVLPVFGCFSVWILSFFLPLLFKIFGWLLLISIPVIIYDFKKNSPSLIHFYEIDKNALMVKRTFSDGQCETRSTGQFRELKIFRTVMPRGGFNIYLLLLICENGVITLMSLHSLRDVEAYGKSLSEWLSIPIMSCQQLLLAGFLGQELFPRYNRGGKFISN